MIKRRNFNKLVAASVLAVLPMAGFAQNKDPVKVGVLTSRTGVWAEMGEEVARGIMFSIDNANAAGGVEGRKILVAEGDDEGNPDAGRRGAEKLARSGHNLLIGSIGSAVSLAIVQGLDRWDAAYFATISKTDRLSGDSCKARSIRTVQSDAIDIAMINKWAPKIKGENFAVIASDYAWGHDSSSSFKKAVESSGKKVSLSLFVPLGAKDYSPYISQLKAAKVDAIWAAIPARDGIAFIKQAGEFGLLATTPVIGHAMLSEFIVRATGNNQEGMVGTLGYGADFQYPLNQAFVKAWKEKFNRVPTETEALGYLGSEVMLEGVRRAKSVKPAEVTAALRGAEVDTILGKLTVRAADNQLVVPNFVARVKNVDGEMRPVIEEVFTPDNAPPASPLCKM